MEITFVVSVVGIYSLLLARDKILLIRVAGRSQNLPKNASPQHLFIHVPLPLLNLRTSVVFDVKVIYHL